MAVKLFAAIGIGSGVTSMKIFQFNSRREMKEIEFISTRLNLGLDAYQDGKINRDNIEALCSVLLDFKRIMLSYNITDYRIRATSAFRESRNMLIMRDYIEKQTGLRIGVLSNSEQRFVDYKAIASVTAEFSTIIQSPAAIVDIGGNSLQVSLFDKDKLITTQNIHVGSVTAREDLMPLANNTAHFEKMVIELLNHELAGFAKLYQKDRQIRNLIVIGGGLSEVFERYTSSGRKIRSLESDQFATAYEGILSKTPDEIADFFGVTSDTAQEVIPSAIVCRCLLDNFGAQTLWLPQYSICDGMAYDFGTKNHLITGYHNFEEDIIAAARSISKRYKCNQSHVKNLEEMALQVFDRMKKVHGMGKRERLLLQIAIILHNCGKFISLEDVSDCAFNIIMATEIIGLSHAEREMIAYTVKFNNSPFVYYDELAINTDLNQEQYMIVAKLTAILRVVNALDRTHKQKCKNLVVTLKEHELRLLATTPEDLTLEKASLKSKTDFFEEVFNVQLIFKQKKPL